MESTELREPGVAIPKFTVSPWEMLKAFSWTSRAKLLYHALRIIHDPERTEEIFAISSLFLNVRVDGRSGLADYTQSLFDLPGLRALYEERYLPKPADIDALLRLPEGTLGNAYARHMRANNLSVVFYPEIDIVDEMSYLEMRGRQTHDILHVVTGFGTSVPDELGLQAFVLAQINSPLSGGIIGGGLVHASAFKPWLLYDCTEKVAQGFAMGRKARNILSYRFEDNWTRRLAAVRAELGL